MYMTNMVASKMKIVCLMSRVRIVRGTTRLLLSPLARAIAASTCRNDETKISHRSYMISTSPLQHHRGISVT